MSSTLELLPFLPLFPSTTCSFFTFILLSLAVVAIFSPAGIAWSFSRRRSHITGAGDIALSGATPHRMLSSLSHKLASPRLMAFSVGLTRFIISSHPETAKEILNASAFADRPFKESARELMFHRAIGFAPFGEYWRNLRRIAATHLFCPRRIAAFSDDRKKIGEHMVEQVKVLMEKHGEVKVKTVLHFGSLNNIMMSVFGKFFDFEKGEGIELERMVREGYALLGVLNWSDHLPLLRWLDLQGVRRRSKVLADEVNSFVGKIVEEHRIRGRNGGVGGENEQIGDFVDVLLDLEKDEKLSNTDMIAILWEMIFRGTDTVATLLEWIIARMILHPEIQEKAKAEIDVHVGKSRLVTDADIPNLHYLQCIVKECLRMHPPGPLLSWARIAIHDVHVDNHLIPAGTTAMVNMWAITHDKAIWSDPDEFKPERFLTEDVNIMGSDLRLAPFGSGRRVCPGKAMGMATVHLWLAQLLQSFKWLPSSGGVDLSECLKMSLEMKNTLVCCAVPRD